MGKLTKGEQEVLSARLETLLRHIGNVRDNCGLLGHRLIERGEKELGKRLIANGHIHDNSKFFGVEWEYLHEGIDEELRKMAALQHIRTNPHHPEYWNSIHNMPRLYVCEMVADWKARSSEFGNDLRGWIKGTALKRFDMKVQSKVYKEIKEVVELLLEPEFK